VETPRGNAANASPAPLPMHAITPWIFVDLPSAKRNSPSLQGFCFEGKVESLSASLVASFIHYMVCCETPSYAVPPSVLAPTANAIKSSNHKDSPVIQSLGASRVGGEGVSSMAGVELVSLLRLLMGSRMRLEAVAGECATGEDGLS
jgi:hypothetical protein